MLQSLDLFGFKSFVDRTRFDFDPGITGIVGPNGSGKSNVVDAIKWILGDQSPKSMRGKEMTDVIFNGASGRKSAGFAEATLTFNNENQLLPIESSEVQIGRRIWQNGDSEYLINGTTSRLKDIRNLFLGTGSSAYSIIEQGRVGAILQANPSTRRAVFEEAAGISRYKARRIEALRKLERVGQNLLRLTDIVDKDEVQLNSTRNQAQKATTFRRVSEELKEWWIGLAADDYREHSARLARIETIVSDFDTRINEIETRKQESERVLAGIDKDTNSLDDRIRRVESRRGSEREQIARLEATVGHQRRRSEELDGDRLELTRIAARLSHRFGEAERLGERAELELEEFAEAFEEATRNRNSAAAELETINRQIELERGRFETIRRTQLEQTRIVAACHEKVTGLEGRLGTQEIDQKETAEQLEQLAELREECENTFASLQSRVAELKAELEAIDDNVTAAKKIRDGLLDRQTEAVKELSAARERRSGHQARIAVLEKLERRQEGIGLGVREILERARTADQSPWNLIRGSVSDLLEVDLERAPLVDVALGESAQWIVIDQLAPLGDYLLEHTSRLTDRVGFLSADAPEVPHSPSSPDLSGQPGVIGPVADGVRAHDGNGWLIGRLLAGSWIVNTLADALRLSRGPGRGARFVTLQGEMIERDGTLMAGPISTDASPLSRRSELRRLRTELDDLEAQIEADQDQLGDLDESLVSAECDHTAATSLRESAADRMGRAETEARDQQRELENTNQKYETLAAELERLEQDRQSSRQELDTAQQEQHTSAKRHQELEAQAASIQADQETLREQRATREETLDLARLEVTRQEERRSSLQEACTRRIEDLDRHSDELDEARRRLGQTVEQHQDVNLQILNTGNRLAELALVDERHGRDIKVLVADRNRLKLKRTKLATEDNHLLEEIGQLRQEQHEEQLKAQEIRLQFDAMNTRLQDEYQIGLEDLEHSEASAFQLHLAELARPDTRTDLDADQPGEELPGDSEEEPAAEENTEADLAEAEDPVPLPEQTGDKPAEPLEPPPGVTFEAVRDELEAKVSRLRRKLKMMGSINTDALDDLEELEKRYEHLQHQQQDLVKAKATLEEIVRRLDEESQRLFRESFVTIQEHFKEMFRKLFGGGESDIILEDHADVLDCAIDIVARPPGKELRSLSLLSGGEKTLTAVALVLAIFKSNPSPFCVLDEVDAALDDANIERYTSLLTEFAETTQFIMITHRKRTMTVADVIYGVTMEQPGVSKRISVRLDDVSEDGEIASTSPDGETDAA